ncbi:YcxB family protein [Methylobacterium brachythecii]|uniref:YcxB-like protein domain-containing protein n=1 Tax=Methylobacterium brachythecii TaxID=1176177 RepID=A0A7W6AG85_9HYPH|nr:YcxB family protein [Methylobacterium brachythecii]MBB3900674.1 hypothetical protein [Methylobacterium brachythecii]GLS43551.1 hypothetical protein GCM10007884_15360 [Methylobacterium brachythecii]
MGVVPSIRAAAPVTTPTQSLPEFEVEITLDDWADALLAVHEEAQARQRRRILTVFLPVIWGLTLLGIVSEYATAGGRRSIAGFFGDLEKLSLMPAGIFLGIITAGALVAWATRLWRLRRAIRNDLRADFRQPLRIRYRIDEDGVASDEGVRSGVVPWHWYARLAESDRCLVLVASRVEEPTVIPKRGLDPALLRELRSWCGLIGDTTRPSVKGELPARANALRLSYVLGAADYAAVTWRAQELPKARWQRAKGFLILFAILSLIAPLLFVFGWVVDPYRLPLDVALPLFIDMFGDLFWMPALAVAVLLGLLWLAQRPLRRRSSQAWGRHFAEQARPGTIQAAIDEDGIATRHDGATARFSWASFEGFERTSTHVFLPLARGLAIPLSLTILDAPAIARIEALAAAHGLPRKVTT